MITVKVTQSHIEQGEPSSSLCPLALALQETQQLAIEVDADSVLTWNAVSGSYRILAYLSRRAQRFVRDFDNGIPVHATTFYFKIGDTK